MPASIADRPDRGDPNAKRKCVDEMTSAFHSSQDSHHVHIEQAQSYYMNDYQWYAPGPVAVPS
jgi:hypothetical protein